MLDHEQADSIEMFRDLEDAVRHADLVDVSLSALEIVRIVRHLKSLGWVKWAEDDCRP